MKHQSIYLWSAALLLLIALAGLAYLGTFTRLHADDFCMAADAAQFGLVGMLAKWYAAWTGRFMFILGTGFLGLAGREFAGWLPALAEGAWLAGLSWAILPLIRQACWPRPRLLAVITGLFGLIVLLSSIPNLFQSFFWQDGFVNYSLPLIGLTFSCGIILRAWLHPSKIWVSAIGVFILAFLDGGFTEAYVAMQVTLFALAFLAALVLGDRSIRRRLLPILGAALAGGLIAMLIVVAAPGNQFRQGVVGAFPGPVRVISFSFRNAAFIYGKFYLKTPFWALFSTILPFLTGWLFYMPTAAATLNQSSHNWWRDSWLRSLVLLGLASFILVAAACAPVVYALNAYPDDRTIIIPQFVIIAAVIAGSALLGAGLRHANILPNPLKRPGLGQTLQIGIMAALLLCAGYSTWQTVTQIPDFQAYALAWDQRAVIIQQAAFSGQAELTVVGLNARFGVADLNADPGYWVNQCMASYYHILTLRGR